MSSLGYYNFTTFEVCNGVCLKLCYFVKNKIVKIKMNVNLTELQKALIYKRNAFNYVYGQLKL